MGSNGSVSVRSFAHNLLKGETTLDGHLYADTSKETCPEKVKVFDWTACLESHYMMEIQRRIPFMGFKSSILFISKECKKDLFYHVGSAERCGIVFCKWQFCGKFGHKFHLLH